MRGFSPRASGPLFSNSMPTSSPPKSRIQHASSMISPPRFPNSILSRGSPRSQTTLVSRAGGTASDKLRREKDALLAELDNVRSMYHGLKVQYDAMKTDHSVTSQEYEKLRQEVQALRKDQAELGWSQGKLKLENEGFRKLKGEIVEEDMLQARSYEDMSREIGSLKQKLKDLDLIDRRRRNEAHIMELEAQLRHVQAKVDNICNPNSRITSNSYLDGDRSRIGFIERPLISLLPSNPSKLEAHLGVGGPKLSPPGMLSPRGNILGDISGPSYINSTINDPIRIKPESFLSPRVQRESHIAPSRVSPIKNALSDPNFRADRKPDFSTREVLYNSPPQLVSMSRILGSPSVQIDRTLRNDENRASIQPVMVSPPVRMSQPVVVSQIPLNPVVTNVPVGMVETQVVGREPSVFEKPFAFPDKYSRLGANPQFI